MTMKLLVTTLQRCDTLFRPPHIKAGDADGLHPVLEVGAPLVLGCGRHVRDECRGQQRQQWQLLQLRVQLTHLQETKTEQCEQTLISFFFGLV